VSEPSVFTDTIKDVAKAMKSGEIPTEDPGPFQVPKPVMPSKDRVEDHQVDQDHKPEPQETPEETDESMVQSDIPDDVFSPKKKDTPEEPDFDPDSVDVESMPDQYKQNVINMRTALKSARKKISELESQKPETVPGDPVELDALKKQLEEANNTIGRIRLEEHPVFKQTFDVKIAQLAQQAEAVVKSFGADTTILSQAVKLEPSKRVEFLKEKIPDGFSMIIPLMVQLDQLIAARGTAIQNHRTHLAKLEAVQQKAQNQFVSEQTEALSTKAFKDLEDEGYFVLKTVPGNDDWNSKTESVRKMATESFGTNDPEEQAKIIVRSAMAPRLLELLNAEKKRADHYAKELQRRTGKLPKLRGQQEPPIQKGKDPSRKKDAKSAAGRVADKFFG